MTQDIEALFSSRLDDGVPVEISAGSAGSASGDSFTTPLKKQPSKEDDDCDDIKKIIIRQQKRENDALVKDLVDRERQLRVSCGFTPVIGAIYVSSPPLSQEYEAKLRALGVRSISFSS